MENTGMEIRVVDIETDKYTLVREGAPDPRGRVKMIMEINYSKEVNDIQTQ